ncbi:Adhesion G Protein-Coupled Receptor L3 [Manis pentadactyla]|nr:Adhesion G Protein-Coupled Receptor L3 [Manis pentadactyla]
MIKLLTFGNIWRPDIERHSLSLSCSFAWYVPCMNHKRAKNRQQQMAKQPTPKGTSVFPPSTAAWLELHELRVGCEVWSETKVTVGATGAIKQWE